jgi:hypothetical protein
LTVSRAREQDSRMKTRNFFPIVLVGIVLVLLNGCATYPKSGQKALVGDWTNSLGTVWMIKADGTFDVDLNHDGKRDAWGTYTVAGDTMTIHGTGGKTPADCKGDGVYKFSRTDKDALSFSFVSDKCKLRKKNVLLGWKRK